MSCGTRALVWVDVALILHNFGLKKGFTTQHKLPFVRHPKSCVLLFYSYIRPIDPTYSLRFHCVFLPFGNVHITFYPQNTQVTNSCILSGPQFQKYLTFHWCRYSTVEYVYRRITGLNPQFFRQSTGVDHTVSAFHNYAIFLLGRTVLFWSIWHRGHAWYRILPTHLLQLDIWVPWYRPTLELLWRVQQSLLIS